MSYARPLRLVHWTIAILVTCQLAIAVVLTQLRSLGYGQLVLSLHRQLGLVILLLVIARLVLIRRQPMPASVSSGLPSWQLGAAALVHGAFYVILVVQPIVGMLVAWARGDAVGLFGLIQITAPFEMSDVARERLMTVHAITAVLLFSLCLLHVGAVLFNRVVRGVSVIDRMLAPIPGERVVNRVPIAAQLSLGFGLVIGIALIVGINAVATYRDLSRATEAFQAGDLAVADQLRAAQVAWKDRYYLASADHPDTGHLKELEDTAKSSLEDAQSHATADIKTSLTRVIGQLSSTVAMPEGSARTAAIKAIDSQLQDLVDSQSIQTLQHRSENDDKAARGHDLIVVTVLPMLLAGITVGLLLARSITGALSRMGGLIKSIEADQRDSDIQVEGAGEIATLTRDIVSMRVAVERRGNEAAARQSELEAERTRMAQDQLQREAEAQRQQSIARRAQREQLASEFEAQVAGIVSTVAQAAQALSSTAANMATSASTASERSRDASTVAELTSGTSSEIAAGTGELSTSAQSVRENAEQSKSRAELAVKEAADTKEQIDRLVTAVRQISGITDLIATVARKTNLLAINARIEAARAGEVGRGFSIVADEVKALASQTHAATTDIEKQIKEMNAAAGHSSESLQRLSEVIAGVDQATSAIFAATDAQFASTRQLAQRVSEISSSMGAVAQDIRGAQETAHATEQMSTDVVNAAAVIDQQAEELREKVADFVLQLRNAGAVSNAGAAPSVDTTPSADWARSTRAA
ncbi:MAG: cytochrome b/b6 domain-containing protein [Sinobacteraceae bacterium]|nr:cytochrome b/b6 domain-containing protein [Nevskiaceae bacterium]